MRRTAGTASGPWADTGRSSRPSHSEGHWRPHVQPAMLGARRLRPCVEGPLAFQRISHTTHATEENDEAEERGHWGYIFDGLRTEGGAAQREFPAWFGHPVPALPRSSEQDRPDTQRARTMITDIEDYFTLGCGRCDRFRTADCSTRRWEGGLAALRDICLDLGLVETVKWGHPCYMHGDRNVAILGAFRSDFRLNFFDAALLQDSEGILEKRGANTQHPDMIRFSENSEVREREGTIRQYLTEMMGYAEAGTRPPRVVVELEWPDELVEALAADSELASAFHALTPGRQRSYLINLNSARKSATRVTRIGKFRDRIIQGKGALER